MDVFVSLITTLASTANLLPGNKFTLILNMAILGLISD